MDRRPRGNSSGLYIATAFGGAIVSAAGSRNRCQIGEGSGIATGLAHRRHLAAIALGEALGERARFVVEVPVKSGCQQEAIRRFQSERMDVVDEDY
jgi:hypothetical protein